MVYLVVIFQIILIFGGTARTYSNTFYDLKNYLKNCFGTTVTRINILKIFYPHILIANIYEYYSSAACQQLYVGKNGVNWPVGLSGRPHL